MSLKEYKPVTSSQRGLVLVDKSDLYKGKSLKSKTKRIFSSGGRNNTGRITVRHHGGGNKRLYRIIDFKRHLNKGKSAIVLRLEYDPNRTSFIALIEYSDGNKDYIIAPQKLAVGDIVIASEDAEIKPGNALPLINIPVGTLVHNIEMKALKGGQLSRSAGCYAQVIGKEGNYVQLTLSSGEKRVVRSECWATVGAVSNPDNMNQKFAKAGRMRWKGIRPTVRGVAMNPVDHPHGGGEGRTSGGRHPVTPWGISTKGKKTRSNKSTSKYIISDRRKVR